MIKTYTCTNGHVWSAEPDVDDTGFDQSDVCPECGSRSDPSQTLLPGGAGPTENFVPPQRTKDGDSADARADGAADPSPDRYLLEQALGGGGMGIVYKAHDRKLRRYVALKVIRHGAAATAAEIERFYREAEAIAQLNHPHIVPIYDFGDREGQPYFTMEYLEGGDLANHPACSSRDPRAMAQLFEKLARAMHAAHDGGIVHRDLKPTNVLLTSDGEPKITDFGLVKRLDTPAELTREGAAVGTPAYMAPEQRVGKSKDIGPAADIYALGVMLYEALTGRRPFPDSNDLETLKARIEQEAPPPSQWQRGIPRDVETICLKCLRAAAGQRYESAAELADDLRRFLDHEPIRARRIGLAPRLMKWARRRPVKAIALAAMLAALLAAAYGLWYVDSYVLERVEYYGNVAYRWGIPEGVEPLSEDEVRHREFSYELIRRGRRRPPDEVRVITWQFADAVENNLVTWFDGLIELNRSQRWSRMTFLYDSRGELMREIAYNLTGDVVYELQYSATASGQSGEEKLMTARYFRERGLDLSMEPLATVVELHHNDQGRARHVRFLGNRGNPMVNREGVFGYKLTYNDQGLIEKTMSLDRRGKEMPNRLGICGARSHYENGHDVSTEYLDVDGDIATRKDGFAIIRVVSDDYGNPTSVSFRDENGDLTERAGVGAAEVRYEYQFDPPGLRLRERYFDRHGTRIAASSGSYAMESGFDRYRREIAHVSRLENGQTAAATTNRYAKGRIAETRFFDDAARTRLIGRQVFEYNDDGRPESERVYAIADGRETLFEQTDRSFDDQRRLVEVTYRDGSGGPRREDEGYSRLKRTYHASGAVATMTSSGYELAGGFDAELEEFNENEELISRSFSKNSGEPATGPGGFHQMHIDRDGTGRPIDVRFYALADGDLREAATEVAVVEVEEGDASGLYAGDVLVRYDGDPVESSVQFSDRRDFEDRDYFHKPLLVRRNGEPLSLQVGPGPLGVVLRDRLPPQAVSAEARVLP